MSIFTGNQPLSNRRNGSQAVAFGILMLVGLGMLYPLFIGPALKVLAARSWTATGCRIVSSEVGEHSGTHGTTYSVDITFRYRVGRQVYLSARYNFLGGSSSGYSSKEAIVAAYPRGMRTICYVNPGNPVEAVIERGFTGDFWVGLVPLVFVVIGAVGLFATSKRRRAAMGPLGETGGGMMPVTVAGVDFGVAPMEMRELKPAQSRVLQITVTSLMAVLFNAVEVFLVRQLMEQERAGVQEIGLMFFAVVWGLFCALLVWIVVKTIMQAFDPQVHLRLKPGALQPGKKAELEWEMKGGWKKFSQFKITLECKEETLVQGNKESHMISKVCYRAEVIDTETPEELVAGRVSVAARSGVMHSLNTGRNKVSWNLRVEGNAPGWAGIKDDYPVVMLPELWKEGA